MAHERAVLLDRDGTLVHRRHYPSQPDHLIVYDGIAPELRRLQTAGFKLVVVTNQSGIARGLFTVADLDRMHDHLMGELGRQGVTLDAIYYCPHHVDGIVPELATACACRKPQPGMALRAAGELGFDLRQSWFVGDILDDVEAGHRAGCRAILVDLGSEPSPTTPARRPDYVARDTVHALRIIAHLAGLGVASDLAYTPPSWLASRAMDDTRHLSGAALGGPDDDIR